MARISPQSVEPSPLEAARKEIAFSSGGTSGEPLRRAVLERIQRKAVWGDVVDFGAGTGEFIRLLLPLRCFSSLTGLDLMQRPPDLPRHVQWRVTDLNSPVDYPSESCDLAVSLGLIEYLENPYAFARELYRVLRPGGAAIITTPNNESWRALASFVFRGYFTAFPPKGTDMNLTALVRRDFERILTFAGFADVTFGYTGVGLIPRLKVSWQKLSAGVLRGVRYSDDVIVTCRK
jgi:SAM-dependent methyltransferase